MAPSLRAKAKQSMPPRADGWIASSLSLLAMTERKPSRFLLSMLYDLGMVLDSASMVRQRVVIDDRSRLPGRFFGRFATSATSELTPAA